jgi:hypothetical protein
MIKSTLASPEPSSFPYIMQSTINELIVLFWDRGRGTVMSTGNSHYEIGYYSDGWEFSQFVPYAGTITLRNA